MNRQELVDDAKRAVKSYVERNLEAIGEKMVLPVINIKLGHIPTWEGDSVNDAVLVSRDERTGNVHLYVMTCVMHKEVVENMFGIKIQDYVGHVVIDTEEKSENFFPMVNSFEASLQWMLEDAAHKRKMKFREWDNI